jgi:hypothetical protein
VGQPSPRPRSHVKISIFIDGWNDRVHPFVWTTAVEEIIFDPPRNFGGGRRRRMLVHSSEVESVPGSACVALPGMIGRLRRGRSAAGVRFTCGARCSRLATVSRVDPSPLLEPTFGRPGEMFHRSVRNYWL